MSSHVHQSNENPKYHYSIIKSTDQRYISPDELNIARDIYASTVHLLTIEMTAKGITFDEPANFTDQFDTFADFFKLGVLTPPCSEDLLFSIVDKLKEEIDREGYGIVEVNYSRGNDLTPFGYTEVLNYMDDCIYRHVFPILPEYLPILKKIVQVLVTKETP